MAHQNQTSKKRGWQRRVSALLAFVIVATTMLARPLPALAATNDGQPWGGLFHSGQCEGRQQPGAITG